MGKSGIFMRKIILLAAIFTLTLAGCTLTGGGGEKVSAIGIEAAKVKAADFINKNLLPAGTEATVKEAAEEFGLYRVAVSLTDGQEITTYLTLDGKKFFPQVMDIAEVESRKQQNQAQPDGGAAPAANIPKADKAKAELFVMSFCPYGVQAEAAMSPVIDLLGDKADIQVRFIASVPGDDLNAVKSLHGAIEGIEDARQLCVAKNYDQTTLWKYINQINKDCYPIYRNGEEQYKTCWQKAAKDAGASASKIEACMDSEGVSLIKAEDTAAKGYGVSGSPTLLINGVKFNGGRNPEAYKQAICDGFTTPPAECSETLSSTGATAEGGCD